MSAFIRPHIKPACGRHVLGHYSRFWMHPTEGSFGDHNVDGTVYSLVCRYNDDDDDDGRKLNQSLGKASSGRARSANAYRIDSAQSCPHNESGATGASFIDLPCLLIAERYASYRTLPTLPQGFRRFVEAGLVDRAHMESYQLICASVNINNEEKIGHSELEQCWGFSTAHGVGFRFTM